MSFVATWTFTALAPDRTELTLRQVYPSTEDRETIIREYGTLEGGKQTLARLAEHLPTMR